MNAPKVAPKTFNSTIYLRALSLLQKHRKAFASNAELELARLCGGLELKAALDSTAKPPCYDPKTEEELRQCSKCWVRYWCIHTTDTFDSRKDVKTTNTEKSKENIDFAKGLDDL